MTGLLTTYEILVFLLCFLVHEWGHYILALKYDCRPVFNFKWYGMSIGGLYYKLTYLQYMYVLWAGILIGLIPSFLLNLVDGTHTIFFMAYIAMSGADIYTIIVLTNKISVHGNRKLVDLPFLIPKY